MYAIRSYYAEVHERYPRLWADHDVTEMRLSGLSRGAAATLVRAIEKFQAHMLNDPTVGGTKAIPGVVRGRGDTLTFDFALRQKDVELGDKVIT